MRIEGLRKFRGRPSIEDLPEPFRLDAWDWYHRILRKRQALGLRPDILVEGEIGDIGSGSQIHDVAPDLQKGLTTPAQAKQFVEETRVDTLAPAVGNMHGMLKSMVAGDTKKRLDIERIRAIKAEARIFMTLHGASGTNDDDLREAIAAGITVVHINTEVRLAWRLSRNNRMRSFPIGSSRKWLIQYSRSWRPDLRYLAVGGVRVLQCGSACAHDLILAELLQFG